MWFSFAEGENIKLLCAICVTVISNEHMKSSRLKWTLETKHPVNSNKHADFFKRI